MSFKILSTNSYKIGVDEIEGLSEAMRETLEPVRQAIKDGVYWSEVEYQDAEYKRRDGFIPHSNNLGGPQIIEVIPKCEEYNFPYLTFGEYDLSDCKNEDEEMRAMEMEDSDGLCDAIIRVWLKLESIEGGVLNFYLMAEGGHQDAPYFRQGRQETLFEAEFKAKSMKGLKRAAAPHITKLLKVMGAK